jgi:hypothetical protein
VVVGVLIGLLYVPVWALVPDMGLDPSWRLGLSWAFDLGYDWGTEIAFTYGPLGWTADPMAFARDQVLFALLLHVVATAAALLIADLLAREQLRLSRWPALGVAVAATALSLMSAPATLVLALFGSVAVLVQPRWWLVAVAAVSVALLGHQKLTEAVLAATVAFVCAFGGLGWRGALGLTIMAVASWVGLWLLLGQDPGALVDHVIQSIDVSVGFAAAQARPKAGIMWQHVVAAMLVLLLLAQAFEAGRRRGRRQRACLLAGTAVAGYLMVRAGFTRHDDGHLVLFFGYVIVLGTVLVLGTGRGHRHWLGTAAVVLAFGLMTWVTPGRDWLRPIERAASLRSFERTVSVLTDDRSQESLLEGARLSLIDRYGLSPELLEALRGQPVAVDPWDVSAAWAAGADWRPVPVFLTINASTPRLDRLAASSLADEPRTVLQALPGASIDGRNPGWETPAYRRLLYCDYEEALTSGSWLVLHPAGESRCGQVHPGGTVETEAGEEIAVPRRPGAVTLATIDLRQPVAKRLLGLLGLPALESIDYGGTSWRWAFGDRAERVMLNDPIGHPTLSGMPPIPHPTISVSAPASVTFEFMGVQSPAYRAKVRRSTAP